jgi:hypothetical protein
MHSGPDRLVRAAFFCTLNLKQYNIQTFFIIKYRRAITGLGLLQAMLPY